MGSVEFPILNREVHGRRLAYLDSAATTQKPQRVVDRLTRFYELENANVHRGVHHLSEQATLAFDAARANVAAYLGVQPDEVIFTKGCTEAINLVAASWGRSLTANDRILVSGLEHHANLVPWQQTVAQVEPIPLTPEGDIDLDALSGLLDERVKLVCVTELSNAIGTRPPLRKIGEIVHGAGALLLVDGAQGLSHGPSNLREFDADFYAMSAHKSYGPMGFGALFGRAELLRAMPPYQTGGGMIRKVSFEGTTFADIPEKFEPGTPHVAGALAWSEAIDFLREQDWDQATQTEDALVRRLREGLSEIPGVRLIGAPENHAAVVSFVADWVHPHDLGTLLDQEGVAVRVGHHCCQPLMRHFGVPATCRASFGLYNVTEDVDQCLRAVHRAREIFA